MIFRNIFQQGPRKMEKDPFFVSATRLYQGTRNKTFVTGETGLKKKKIPRILNLDFPDVRSIPRPQVN